MLYINRQSCIILGMNYIYRVKVNEDGTMDIPDELKQMKGTSFDMVLHPVNINKQFMELESIANSIPTPAFDEAEIDNIINEVRKTKS